MRQKKCDISSIHIKTPQKKILAVQEKKRGKKKMLAVHKKFFGTFVFAKKKGQKIDDRKSMTDFVLTTIKTPPV